MKSCKYPHCNLQSNTAGYCSSHYAARRRSELSLVLARQELQNMPHIEEWHCVYIIGCNELVPIKVGRTANIMSRLDGMQTGCPYQLKLHDAFFAPKNVITWLEWDAHRKLHDFGFGVRDGLRSEWFDIDPKEAADVVKKCAEIEGFEICDVRRFAAMAREQKGKSPPEWIDRIEAIGFMVYGVLGAQ